MSIVTLEQAQAQLSIPDDAPSAKLTALQEYVDAITPAVEEYKGQVIEPRSITEELDLTGQPRFMLSSAPVISLTSVAAIDGSITYDIANLHASPSGRVTVLSGAAPTGFVSVVYQAGYEEIPANYVRGALVILQHVWETQRGVSTTTAGVVGTEENTMQYNFIIPRKALEWLGPPIPGVA